MVYGVLAEEVVDKTREIMDYARSKPHFKAWSESFDQITKGKSKGNLRRMHQPHVAGHFEQVVLNDELKRVEVAAKVTDDEDWKKCLAGDYTGFSVGGDYVETWQDDVLKVLRYEGRPAEGSLVDNPCMYGAQFSHVKADGAEELRKFAGAARLEKIKPIEAALMKLAELTKDDVPAEAAAPAAVAIAGIAEVKAKLQEVLSSFALLPTDRTSFEMHELINALNELDYAAYTARQIRAEAMAAEPSSEPSPADKTVKPAVTKDAPASTDPPTPADPPADLAAAAPAATQQKESPDAAKATDVASLAKSVHEALASSTELIKAQLASLKDGLSETVTKTVDTAVKQATESHQKKLEELGKRIAEVAATPAAIGRPAQPAEKTLGGTPGAAETPMDADAVQKVLGAMKGKVSGQVLQDIALDLASKAMPR